MITGAAADAKKTGDEITHLKDDLSELTNDVEYVAIKDVYSGATSYSNLPGTEKNVNILTDVFNERLYTTKLNAFPVKSDPVTLAGVTWSSNDIFYTLTGTYDSSGGYFIFDWENISLNEDIVSSGDNVVFCIKADISLKIWLRYKNVSGSTNNIKASTIYNPIEHMEIINFTLPSDFKTMRVSVFGGDTSYAGNGKVWFGLYESVDFVSCSETFVSASSILDTLYNTMSIETYKNTKEYVDGVINTVDKKVTDLEDDVKDGITFLTPEMFQAVGDGTTDDTVEFQACIDAAISTRTPIRAQKRYKITDTLKFVGDYQDLKINELIYTGTSAAIECTCNFSKIEINRILATSTNAVGIVFTDRESGSPDRCQNNLIKIGTLWTSGNCMEFRFPNEKPAYYNEIHLRRGHSSNANIIYIGMERPIAVSECDFYGAKYLSCANGYVIYIENCGYTYARFHEFAMEGDCKNGVYGVANLINCRTAEMLDTYDPEDEHGFLFKVKGIANGITSENTRCDYLSIDMSNAMSWAEVLEEAQRKVDDGCNAIDLYYHFGTNFDCPSISYCNRVGSYKHFENNTQRLLVMGTLKIVYDKVIFIPNKRCSREIVESVFVAYDTDYTFPTDFIADTIDCTITLNDSYCCIGINDNTVEQKNGVKAVVVDKNGTTIFDGTELNDGIYRLTCTFEPLGAYTVHGLETERSVTLEAYTTANIYTGSNERWFLT